MLSTVKCGNVEIDNYGFNGSPESSGDDSFISDYFDSASPSDEDFLQQLSADLDIPLLLNPGEEEMSLLNSFLDKSPEEILSEILAPVKNEYDFMHTDIKIEQSDDVQEISKLECSPSLEQKKLYFHGNVSGINGTKVQKINIMPPLEKSKDLCLKVSKGPPKQTTHNPYIIPTSKNKNLVPIPNGIPNILPRNVVFLDNRTLNLKAVVNTSTNSSAAISYISPLSPQSPSTLPKTESISLNFIPLNSSQTLDTRAFKRQQRMIKNRESACLSRKRKRDYVTSLERIVQQLTEENEHLKTENKQLRDQLSGINNFRLFSFPSKTVTKALTVCAVFCVMGFNINFLPNPLSRNNLPMLNTEQLLKRDHHGRSLLWAQEFATADNKDTYNTANKSNNHVNSDSLPVCPVNFNQSENVRLVLELHRLIGKPYHISEDFDGYAQFAQNKSKTNKSKVGRFRHRSIPLSPSPYKTNKRNRKVSPALSVNNELQVFSPYSHHLYPEFFEAINRQDDTFYLVSLSSDHLLLPALNYNKTTRPKMSLLVPSIMQKLSGTQKSTISLMQIDCEVLDTKLLHVKYGSIPQHLRSHSNISQPISDDEVHQKENTEVPASNSYKPYFMRKAYSQLRNTTGGYDILNRHETKRSL